jgi:hypothetical protein
VAQDKNANRGNEKVTMNRIARRWPSASMQMHSIFNARNDAKDADIRFISMAARLLRPVANG